MIGMREVAATLKTQTFVQDIQMTFRYIWVLSRKNRSLIFSQFLPSASQKKKKKNRPPSARVMSHHCEGPFRPAAWKVFRTSGWTRSSACGDSWLHSASKQRQQKCGEVGSAVSMLHQSDIRPPLHTPPPPPPPDLPPSKPLLSLTGCIMFFMADSLAGT